MLQIELPSLDLAKTNVLCVYGIKEGALYHQYKDWLHENEERYLIFFDEVEVDLFLQAELIQDEKVRLYSLHANEEEIFKQVAWEFLFLHFSYTCDPSDQERANEIFTKMDYYQRGVHLLASDYSDYGKKIISNVKKNSLLSAKRGDGLFGKFTKIPAIICGAGPSLSSVLSILEKCKDKALIFAGGAALNILSQRSIIPHFAANIDPDPPYQRFLEQSLVEVPFFYQTRVSKEILSIVHGPLLWIPDSGGHPLESWLYNAEPFDGGWNVATFCTALSVHMGCDPIIFVGMDLALSQGKLYAAGVDEAVKKDGLIQMMDKKGNLILTKKDWAMAAEWLGEFAKEQPSHFINATEEGLCIEGVNDLGLETIAELYLKKTFDLDGLVRSAISQLPAVEIKNTFLKAEESFAKCEKICRELIENFERTFPQLSEKLDALEIELSEEIGFKKFLDPLWNIWKHVFLRRLPNKEAWEINLNKWLFFLRALKELQNEI